MSDRGVEMSLGTTVRLLVATLHHEHLSIPFKDQRPWHMLFYRLKTALPSKKPIFLDGLIFDWDGPYPRCEELADFLNALHFTASVAAHNPRFDVITVDDQDAERWSRDVERLDPGAASFFGSAVAIARKEFEAIQPIAQSENGIIEAASFEKAIAERQSHGAK